MYGDRFGILKTKPQKFDSLCGKLDIPNELIFFTEHILSR